MFPEVAAKLAAPAQEELGRRLAARLGHLRGSPVTRARLRAKWELLHRL